MKKVCLVLVAVFMVFSSSMAFADTKVTIGLKSWYNWWEESVDYAAGGSDTYDYGSAFMVGPSLNVKFGKVFLGATYLTSLQDYESTDQYTIGDKLTLERRDLDLTLGVMFTPYFGMFVGHKTLEAPITYTHPVLGTYGDVTWKLKGPGIGLLGNIPLGGSAAFYGSLAVLDMEEEYVEPTGTTTGIDMLGVAGEVGVAFAFSESVSANVGLKAQSFWGDEANGDAWDELFTGLSVGLNFTF